MSSAQCCHIVTRYYGDSPCAIPATRKTTDGRDVCWRHEDIEERELRSQEGEFGYVALRRGVAALHDNMDLGVLLWFDRDKAQAWCDIPQRKRAGWYVAPLTPVP